jgi:hypothetical protein
VAHAGYVVFAGVRKEADRKSIQEQADKEKAKVVPIILDVTRTSEIDSAYDTVRVVS